MTFNSSPIAPTWNPLLEQALRDKLKQRAETTGSLGELEALAIRVGLMQNTLKPRFRAPQLVLFAADHGLVVDGMTNGRQPTTAQRVSRLLSSQLPVSVFARIQGLEMSVVDAGVAEPITPHVRLFSRKIAHGTRNARFALAMTQEHTHAAVRAGMEISDAMPGNMAACACVGEGANESAALMISRLSGSDVREFVMSGPDMDRELLAQMLVVLKGAQARHWAAIEAMEVLSAFGGFDIAMMVGLMLVAASKRSLLMIDGLPALAALMVAARISPAVSDYCVFCRSHNHQGLSQALGLFNATALLELGMDSIDGTGATLAWPMVRSAAALLTEVAEGEDPGPSQPAIL
jgi:nicotinate-nucleotide--dimethylbenzimidazole phosphoribosyltransferase